MLYDTLRWGGDCCSVSLVQVKFATTTLENFVVEHVSDINSCTAGQVLLLISFCSFAFTNPVLLLLPLNTVPRRTAVYHMPRRLDVKRRGYFDYRMPMQARYFKFSFVLRQYSIIFPLVFLVSHADVSIFWSGYGSDFGYATPDNIGTCTRCVTGTYMPPSPADATADAFFGCIPCGANTQANGGNVNLMLSTLL